jgi:hypothetical protein
MLLHNRQSNQTLKIACWNCLALHIHRPNPGERSHRDGHVFSVYEELFALKILERGEWFCRKQETILGKLLQEPKFKKVALFKTDYDSNTELLREQLSDAIMM